MSRRSRQPWSIKKITREKVIRRDGQQCVRCHKPHELHTAHIDHIVPLSCGGTNHIRNQRTLCPTCHCLRIHPSHRGLIGWALKNGLIPVNYRPLMWRINASGRGEAW